MKHTRVLFLLPSLLGTTLFFLLPFGDVIRRSFSDGMGNRFVGLQNYKAVLENTAFRLALKNTVRFTLISLLLLLPLSLMLALAIKEVGKGQEKQGSLLHAVLLLPFLVPSASIALIWKMVFGYRGILQAPGQKDWLHSPAAFWILVFSFLWKNLGYDALVWSVGLARIEPDLYEAAALDGAGVIGRFRFVTLPCLRDTLPLVLLLSLLATFQAFREAYLATGDYPHESMYLFQHLFNNWFSDLRLDKMAAGTVLLAGSLFLIGLANNKHRYERNGI